MNTPSHSRTGALALLALLLGLCALPASSSAQTAGETHMGGVAAPVPHDGQHDFDFLIGNWTFHLRKLVNPLTGSTTWQEFDGTGSAQALFGGRANIDQVSVEGPSGRIEGLTLRMYDPKSREWSLYWGSMRDGNLGRPVVPTVGSFRDGRGTFYDHEPINGRMILVRYEWFDITPNSASFEQSFSADGGRTWEVNWASKQTRIPVAAAKP